MLGSRLRCVIPSIVQEGDFSTTLHTSSFSGSFFSLNVVGFKFVVVLPALTVNGLKSSASALVNLNSFFKCQ